MNAKQFEILVSDLNKLCGSANNGFYTYRGMRFQVRHAREGAHAWVELATPVIELNDGNTFDSISSALVMNSAVFRNQANPAWFALEGEETPSITLIQRIYAVSLQTTDLLRFIALIREKSDDLLSQVKDMGDESDYVASDSDEQSDSQSQSDSAAESASSEKATASSAEAEKSTVAAKPDMPNKKPLSAADLLKNRNALRRP